MSYETYLKNTVNGTNLANQTPLDITIENKYDDTAECLLSHLGQFIRIDHEQNISTSVAELSKIVPGNQQSEITTDPAMMYTAEKMHPVVTTMINGMFDIAGKLLEITLSSHNKKQRTIPSTVTSAREIQNYNLNSTDSDGMTYLHHLFANFD